MEKLERRLLGIYVLRRFGALYPGLTRQVGGQQQIVPYRIGSLCFPGDKEAARVRPYEWLGGRRVIGTEAGLVMLNSTLSLLEERNAEIAALKEEIIALKRKGKKSG